jgi:hypothetical protein
MKKHIFGFALFSFIVASFVFTYAFFSAPSLVSKEAVKPPVSQYEPREEKPYSCNFRKNKLSYEVLSSQYFVDENRIVSRIRVSLDDSVAPSRIYVGATFSSAGNIGKNGYGDQLTVENPFSEGREKIVTIVSNVTDGKKIDIDENLYVTVTVADYDGSTNYRRNGDVSQAKSVLFVYGKSSMDKLSDPRLKR